jgi:hypothetical protein
MQVNDDYVPGCFTVREIAETYGISEGIVWDAIKARRLKTRINRFSLRMATPEAIDAWAEPLGMTRRAPTPSWEK